MAACCLRKETQCFIRLLLECWGGWQMGDLAEWGLFGLIYSVIDVNRCRQFRRAVSPVEVTVTHRCAQL